MPLAIAPNYFEVNLTKRKEFYNENFKGQK
jgi:hypothetical protein